MPEMAPSRWPRPPSRSPRHSRRPPRSGPHRSGSRAPTHRRAEAVASRLRQLDQLKQSGLLGEAEYAERRKQILAEL